MSIFDTLGDAISEIDEWLELEPGPVNTHLMTTLAHMRYSMMIRIKSPETSDSELLAYLDTQDLSGPEHVHLRGGVELLRDAIQAQQANGVSTPLGANEWMSLDEAGEMLSITGDITPGKIEKAFKRIIGVS